MDQDLISDIENNTTKCGSSQGTPKKQCMDRMIPLRSCTEQHDVLSPRVKNIPTPSPTPKNEHARVIKECLGAKSDRVLVFKEKPPVCADMNSLHILYSQNLGAKGAKMIETENLLKKKMRVINNNPERILDAPDLVDDYYLNLLDWSSQNVVGIALSSALYCWLPETGSISKMVDVSNGDSEDYISSLRFSNDGNYLAVGLSNCTTQIWDVNQSKLLRKLPGHSSRVSSLDWNAHIISTGGRDSVILSHDVRIANPIISSRLGHEQEVCGLRYSPDGCHLASGGNDNRLCLWDTRLLGRDLGPRERFTEHLAAVKALAWSPHQRNLLASGGGTSDRTIKLWNAASGTLINSVDTGSQVCSLLWNPHEKELLSSHGFSENQLCLWRFPTMQKIKELKGHTARVLHMAPNPEGTMVCSAAADETLRFWRVFGSNGKPQLPTSMSGASMPITNNGNVQTSSFQRGLGLR